MQSFLNGLFYQIFHIIVFKLFSKYSSLGKQIETTKLTKEIVLTVRNKYVTAKADDDQVRQRFAIW